MTNTVEYTTSVSILFTRVVGKLRHLLELFGENAAIDGKTFEQVCLDLIAGIKLHREVCADMNEGNDSLQLPRC